MTSQTMHFMPKFQQFTTYKTVNLGSDNFVLSQSKGGQLIPGGVSFSSRIE